MPNLPPIVHEQPIAHLLLKKAPVILLVLQPDQTVSYINDYGCRLTGYSKEEVLGQNWIEEFVIIDNKERIKEYFDSAIQEQTEIISNYENSIRTKTGDILFISWNSELLRDDTGMVYGMVTIGEDVTDKKILLKKLLRQESVSRSQLNKAIEEAKAKERDEIASELHDNINQSLTTCKLLLEQELQREDHLPFVNKAFNILQETIGEIRSLSHRLSSNSLSYSDFYLSLKDVLAEIQLATGIQTHLSISGGESLNKAPIAITANVFRIVQEQLNNIVKHANARSIYISLQADRNSINLEIKDDGLGFDLNSIKNKKGLGLKSIFNRAELCNGTVYIDTAPGQGCLISLFIPLG